jgi:uncharacterized membrane protein YdbT with pleckstrin-like domain
LADKLLPGERLVKAAHRHWIVLVAQFAFPVALLALAIIVDLLVGAASRDVKTVITLAALAVGGFWAIVVWVQWASVSFTLTDQRVILQAGVFSRATKVIALDRVQDVSTRQSLLGRLLSYGRVEIDAAGMSGAELLDHVPAPGEFRDEVFVQAERRRASAPAPAVPEPT